MMGKARDKIGIAEALEAVREDLYVGKQVLLGVAWCREDERQLFCRYPEILMVDTTFQTNNQGRPLFTSVGVGRDMESFSPFRVLLPSQCRWVFGWIWDIVAPTLLGPEILERVQLVLTDGDPNIYLSFEQYKDKHYPNAVHGLCAYHLVVKALQQGGRFREFGAPEVKQQIDTFRHWMLGWMSNGGPETDEEFEMSRSLLIEWLQGFQETTDSPGKIEDALAYNSQELHNEYLRIMEYKSRWYFPARKHLFHLRQKTTSKCEAGHHTMKVKSSKCVTPAMTMLQSVKTQDRQQGLRMTEYRWKLQISDGLDPMWADTLTSSSLTRMGESMAKQTKEQKESYTYQLEESTGSILLKRLDQHGTFCHNCKAVEISDETETEENATSDVPEICYSCCNGSPIPTFARVREISFTPLHSGKYVMSYDCADNEGFPCRHVGCLLQMKPHHFAPRWHKEYSHYGERDFPKDRSKYFSEKIRDQRLIVTESEMLQVLDVARQHVPVHDLSELPRTQCFQRKKLREFTQVDNGLDLVNNTGLDNEVGMSQDSEYNFVPDDSDSETHLHQPFITGSFYHDMMSLVTQVEHATRGKQQVRNNCFASFLQWHAKSMSEAYEARPDKGERKRQANSQIVDLFSGTDKRKKCKRLRSKAEPVRKKNT